MVGSVVGHGALLLWALHRDPTPRPEPVEEPLLVQIVEVAPPPTELTPPAPSAEPQPEPKVPAKRRRPRRQRRAQVQPSQAAPMDATPVDGKGVLVPGPPPSRAPAGTIADAQELVRRPEAIDLALQPRASTAPHLVLPKQEKLPDMPRLRPRADGGYDIREGEFSARIAPDGTLTFMDKTALQKWGGLSYQIEITDAVMRAVGDDPYRYQKDQVRRQTAGLRAKMAAAACEVRLKTSIVALKGRLDEIWSDPGLSPTQRRTLLFQMWDDCAESGPQDVLQHAEMARQTIYAFIQRNLPAGSEHGFRPQELDVLNRHRRSKLRFSPQ